MRKEVVTECPISKLINLNLKTKLNICVCPWNRNQLTTSSPTKFRTQTVEANSAKRKVVRTKVLKVPTASSCQTVDCRSWNMRPIRKDTGHRSATRTLEPDTPGDLSKGGKDRTRDPTKFLLVE
jgi:hypothetical protein